MYFSQNSAFTSNIYYPPPRIAFASCNLDFISQNSELTFHNSTFTSRNFDSPPSSEPSLHLAIMTFLFKFRSSDISESSEFPSRNRVVPLRILSLCLVILMYFSRIVNVCFANVDFILRIIIFQIVQFCQFFLLGNSV